VIRHSRSTDRGAGAPERGLVNHRMIARGS
jgi:hypothetical protein